MTPEELMEIRERDPKQKCICKNCADCFHYRDWPAEDQGGKVLGIKKACGIEVLSVTLRRVVGSVDGLQAAVNDSRNRSMEAKKISQNFGAACARAFNSISDGIKLLK